MGDNTAIGGLARSVMFDDHYADKSNSSNKVPVVTVSRDVGASGGYIAELLAKRLSVPCYGYSMIDRIIKDTKSEKDLINIHDEKQQCNIENFIRCVLTNSSATKTEYYSRLIQTVRDIASTGGVILGRGAHLILACHPNVFRVRIEGSLDHCVKRVAVRENITIEKSKEIIALRTKERALFLKTLYKRFPNNLRYSDLVVSTDKATEVDVVDIIVHAMEIMGHYVPVAIKQKSVLV
ncbi:MAG: cytidylate kinase-like family protein [Magnetococcales bacterium]|nr:cytidylate kinase-like family protein [Magnetococcales bacterium]